MTARQGRVALWLAIGAVWIAAGVSGAEAIPIADTRAATIRAVPTDIALMHRDSVRAGTARIIERDLFRPDRRPALVRFGNSMQPAFPAPPTVATPARPPLTLSGLLEGRPRLAVIEGIPGFERGALLGTGEQVGGIRLLRMTGDTVVLHGMDTTWKLTRKRAWQ